MGGSLLAACGGGDSGTLSTLMWEDYAAKPVTGAFQRAEDITLDNSPIGTNEEILTKLRAGAAGSTDVASPNVAYVAAQVQAGVLEPIDLDRIPNTRHYFDYFQQALKDTLTFDGRPYGIPVGWGLDTLVYNSSKIKEPPSSWMDVMKPEYAGKVLLSEGPQANFEIWPRVIGGYDPARLTKAQLDETTEFLIEMKKTHVRAIASSNDDIARLFSTGEVWIGGSGGNPASASVANKMNGDRVSFTIPKEGAAIWVDGLVIPKDPPNEEAAYQFLDYMLRPKPQAQHAIDFYAGVVVENAVPLVSEENRKIVPYDELDTLIERAPVFEFPPPDSGYTTASDWSDAWARIAAA
jgi:spermidine/putrescine transport system substrate-binding protein